MGMKGLAAWVADWRRVDSSIEPVQVVFWLFHIYLFNGLVSFVDLLRDRMTRQALSRLITGSSLCYHLIELVLAPA